MKTIYIDPDFCCHMGPAPDRETVEASFFEGKCDTFAEGYRYIPEGRTWVRSDGEVFTGEMTAPFRPQGELLAAQRQFEAMNRELENAYREGVNSL